MQVDGIDLLMWVRLIYIKPKILFPADHSHHRIDRVHVSHLDILAIQRITTLFHERSALIKMVLLLWCAERNAALPKNPLAIHLVHFQVHPAIYKGDAVLPQEAADQPPSRAVIDAKKYEVEARQLTDI